MTLRIAFRRAAESEFADAAAWYDGHSNNSKDYEFSRATVRQLWQAGLDDVRRTCAHTDWAKALIPVDGMQVYDLSR